jgi:hypothetical protein
VVGTIVQEEAEVETEHLAKDRTPNNPRAATGILAEAEAVVDVAEEGQQEGHQALTSRTTRIPSPPSNNRFKQKEKPWL